MYLCVHQVSHNVLWFKASLMFFLFDFYNIQDVTFVTQVWFSFRAYKVRYWITFFEKWLTERKWYSQMDAYAYKIKVGEDESPSCLSYGAVCVCVCVCVCVYAHTHAQAVTQMHMCQYLSVSHST
jgi:hypothetical protein